MPPSLAPKGLHPTQRAALHPHAGLCQRTLEGEGRVAGEGGVAGAG